MSEGVGVLNRAALEAARAEEIATNQAYYRRLERIAELDRLGVAQATGDRHRGHWAVQMIDGLPWFTPPEWIDPDRRPRPGGRSGAAVA